MAARAKVEAVAKRRSLQIAVGLAGIVPVSAGLAGVIGGLGWVGIDVGAPGDAHTALDSHYRYLSGLLLGIGISFWCMIPTIETSTGPARLLTVVVVAGGVARLMALMLGGAVSVMIVFALAMELIVTPGLCWWQARVARTLA
jgi:Domain of unknown function (DUF4345)